MAYISVRITGIENLKINVFNLYCKIVVFSCSTEISINYHLVSPGRVLESSLPKTHRIATGIRTVDPQRSRVYRINGLLETVRGHRTHRFWESTTYGQKRTFVAINKQFSPTLYYHYYSNLTCRTQYGYVGRSESHAVRQSIEPRVVYSSRRSKIVRSIKKDICVSGRNPRFSFQSFSCSSSNTLLGRTGFCKKTITAVRGSPVNSTKIMHCGFL